MLRSTSDESEDDDELEVPQNELDGPPDGDETPPKTLQEFLEENVVERIDMRVADFDLDKCLETRRVSKRGIAKMRYVHDI